MAASSAQDAFLNTDYPGAEPTMSASDALFDWWDQRWTGKVNNYYADRKEWQNNINYQRALWERDDSYYQRLVADMQKVGLNPFYALNQNLVSPNNTSAQELYKSRRNKEKESKDPNLKGILVTALLLMKLLA